MAYATVGTPTDLNEQVGRLAQMARQSGDHMGFFQKYLTSSNPNRLAAQLAQGMVQQEVQGAETQKNLNQPQPPTVLDGLEQQQGMAAMPTARGMFNPDVYAQGGIGAGLGEEPQGQAQMARGGVVAFAGPKGSLVSPEESEKLNEWFKSRPQEARINYQEAEPYRTKMNEFQGPKPPDVNAEDWEARKKEIIEGNKARDARIAASEASRPGPTQPAEPPAEPPAAPTKEQLKAEKQVTKLDDKIEKTVNKGKDPSKFIEQRARLTEGINAGRTAAPAPAAPAPAAPAPAAPAPAAPAGGLTLETPAQAQARTSGINAGRPAPTVAGSGIAGPGAPPPVQAVTAPAGGGVPPQAPPPGATAAPAAPGTPPSAPSSGINAPSTPAEVRAAKVAEREAKTKVNDAAKAEKLAVTAEEKAAAKFAKEEAKAASKAATAKTLSILGRVAKVVGRVGIPGEIGYELGTALKGTPGAVAMQETLPQAPGDFEAAGRELTREITGRNEGGPSGYNATYGDKGKPELFNKKPLSELPISEVLAISRERGQRNNTGAVGKYQFVSRTLADMVTKAGIDPSEPFSAANQEKLYRTYTAENVATLRRAGIEPTSANVRLAHTAGATGAVRILTAIKNNKGDVPVNTILGLTGKDSETNPQFKVTANQYIASLAPKPAQPVKPRSDIDIAKGFAKDIVASAKKDLVPYLRDRVFTTENFKQVPGAIVDAAKAAQPVLSDALSQGLGNLTGQNAKNEAAFTAAPPPKAPETVQEQYAKMLKNQAAQQAPAEAAPKDNKLFGFERDRLSNILLQSGAATLANPNQYAFTSIGKGLQAGLTADEVREGKIAERTAKAEEGAKNRAEKQYEAGIAYQRAELSKKLPQLDQIEGANLLFAQVATLSGMSPQQRRYQGTDDATFKQLQRQAAAIMKQIQGGGAPAAGGKGQEPPADIKAIQDRYK